jgi:plastocyanin
MNRWLIVVVLACSACEQAPRRHDVAIRNFAFVPDTLRIAAGDTVQFRNEDFVPHTATDAARKWDTGSLEQGATWRTATLTRGTHSYICALHPNMKAILIVR